MNTNFLEILDQLGQVLEVLFVYCYCFFVKKNLIVSKNRDNSGLIVSDWLLVILTNLSYILHSRPYFFLIVTEVKLRDCWTNKADTSSSCDGVNSLMLCMCANSDFCNCHSNPDLNGEKCPLPPNTATDLTVMPFYLLLWLLTMLK